MHIVQQYNEGITVGMLAGLMNSRLSRLHPVSRCMHFTTTFSHCILLECFLNCSVCGWIYSSALRTELKAQLCYHKILCLFHLLSRRKWARETRDPPFPTKMFYKQICLGLKAPLKRSVQRDIQMLLSGI